MNEAQQAAFVAYLIEQRRHLLAQVKACELALAAFDASGKWYNKTVSTPPNGKNVTTTAVIDFTK